MPVKVKRPDTPPSGATTRPLRADAARNLDAVLDAARRVFAVRGVDVPVEEIARDAGVGVGTVYRRFPTKDALLGAVIERSFDELTAAATSALGSADAGLAFFDFLVDAASVMARDRVLVAVARAQGQRRDQRAPAVIRLFDVTDALLARAQAEGAVRAGITAEDVSALLSGVGEAANEGGEPSPGGLARYLAVVVDGLRPRPERSSSRKIAAG
jgi:AcrR family transcriptional regulator